MKWLKVALLLLPLTVGAFQNPAEVHAAQQETRELQDLRAKRATAVVALAKHPKDAATKNKYVFATVQLGMHTMYATTLSPRQKYPDALRLFNEALKVDPTNKDARTQKDLIEAVYKRMGKRPGG